MEDQRYAPHLAADYDRGAAQYRTDDEIEAQSENHRRLGGKLRQMCQAFSHPVRVLEIGCGTGRYFHWLPNVELLVGTDLSAEMLRKAAQPLLAHEVTAKEIRLMHGNIYEMDFPADSFDFIYSLGVFGYGAVWTPELAAKIHRWLAPGGRVFFNAIALPHSANSVDRLKQSIKAGIYPRMPRRVREWFDGRQTVPMVPHTRGRIARIMADAGFGECEIVTEVCRSPLWNGIHLECSARKNSPVEAVRTNATPVRELSTTPEPILG